MCPKIRCIQLSIINKQCCSNLLSPLYKWLCDCFCFSSQTQIWISLKHFVQLVRPCLTWCQTGGRGFGRHPPERCSSLLVWPESSCSLLFGYKRYRKEQQKYFKECAFFFFYSNVILKVFHLVLWGPYRI